METTSRLNPSTVEALQELVRVNRESAQGFRDAAENVASPSLGYLFENVARVREQHASELLKYLRFQNAQSATTGSMRATLHRWWLDLRAWANNGDPYTILAEVERGEDAIKDTYEKLLRDVAANPLGGVLHRQYAEILATHDHMHELRAQWAKKN